MSRTTNPALVEVPDDSVATDHEVPAGNQPRWQVTARIDVHHDRGYPVLDLGTKEIWDGSDLCLIRDTLVDLCSDERCHAVGIEMKSVKGIPTGFFGMLHDLHVDGVAVQLFDPQPHVCRMLWFRTFCESDQDGGFVMHREPKPNVVPGAYHFWASLRGEVPPGEFDVRTTRD